MRKLADSGVARKACMVEGVGQDGYTSLAVKEDVPAQKMAIRLMQMGFSAG